MDVVATSEVSISLTLDPSKIWSRDLIGEELEALKVTTILRVHAHLSRVLGASSSPGSRADVAAALSLAPRLPIAPDAMPVSGCALATIRSLSAKLTRNSEVL